MSLYWSFNYNNLYSIQILYQIDCIKKESAGLRELALIIVFLDYRSTATLRFHKNTSTLRIALFLSSLSSLPNNERSQYAAMLLTPHFHYRKIVLHSLAEQCSCTPHFQNCILTGILKLCCVIHSYCELGGPSRRSGLGCHTSSLSFLVMHMPP